MTTPTHPLAQLISEAQSIFNDHEGRAGISDATALKALKDLLRSPKARQLVVDSVHDQNAAVLAVAVPALEAAQHKLEELRPQYDGLQGASLDRVLAKVGTALVVAKGAK